MSEINLPSGKMRRVDYYDTFNTPAELHATSVEGILVVTLDPPAIYVYNEGQWVPLASVAGNIPAPTVVNASEETAGVAELATQEETNAGSDTFRIVTPARLSGRTAAEGRSGVVSLATAAEVEAGTAGVLVASAARLKAELDRRGALAATEITFGPVELATAAETQTGTDGTRAIHPAGMKAAMTPEAWIAPTLVNGWSNSPTYTDPASLVSASDRGRLETSRPFVKEDCESLAAPVLTQRLEAVSAGSDRVGQVLHARYARTRLEALKAESNRLAREGGSAGPEAARQERALGEAVARLEAILEDPRAAKKAQGLKEAATESRRVARDVRKRVSEADGSDAAARERQRQAIARNF